jgi:hypothetical protein
MHYLARTIASLFLLGGVLVGSCSTPAPQSSPVPARPTAVMDDPFVYCAAVGTIDAPDGRYSGPAMPEVIVQGLVRQGIVSADAPPEFQQSAVWRCVDGRVWVCHFGANLPCQEKADVSQTASAEMEGYCQENPTAEVIPAAVTGRATVYEWKCDQGKPAVVRQVLQVDGQGYLGDFWVELSAP